MAIRTILSSVIPERTTPKLSWQFQDEAGGLITSLDTATILLYDDETKMVRKPRQSLLSDGLNVVSAGVVTMYLTPADTTLLNPSKCTMKLVALIEWTWSSGQRSGKHEIQMNVSNLVYVPV